MDMDKFGGALQSDVLNILISYLINCEDVK